MKLLLVVASGRCRNDDKIVGSGCPLATAVYVLDLIYPRIHRTPAKDSFARVCGNSFGGLHCVRLVTTVCTYSTGEGERARCCSSEIHLIFSPCTYCVLRLRTSLCTYVQVYEYGNATQTTDDDAVRSTKIRDDLLDQ